MFNNYMCAVTILFGKMPKKIVISLGGSVLIPSLEQNRIRKYVPVLREIASRYQLFVVVGGGGEARRYIEAVRGLGIDEGTADEIGILITRLNATMLVAAMGEDAYPRIAESHAEAKRFAEHKKCVIMGGITPGQTTDAVAAVLAERVHAGVFINVTSVDGIYSSDPKKDKKAVRYDHLTPRQLLEIVGKVQLVAGLNTVLDIVAARVVERSGIPLVVLDGTDPENLRSAVLSGTYKGTIVSEKKTQPLPL
jgi:uridylate kinase